MVASNAVREQLLLATDALADERSWTYVSLIGWDQESPEPRSLSEVRRRVDKLLETAESEIRTTQASLSNTEGSLSTLARVRQSVSVLRGQVNANLSLNTGNADFAPRWFQETTHLIEELQSSRLTLLQRERPLEPVLRTEASLRAYAGFLSEGIARNQALMTRTLSQAPKANSPELEAVRHNAGRISMVWELIDSQRTTPLSLPVKAAIESAHDEYNSTFAPLQQSLLTSVSRGVSPQLSPSQWLEVTGRSLRNVALMQQELLRSSRERLHIELAGARKSVALWSVLLLLGAAAVLGSALVVRWRVVQPLEGLSHAMLRLADNDLSTPLPRLARSDEIGEMNDALRVFKANAIKRERIQNEKQILHARLEDAYRQLRIDLEAAAVVQTTMLPIASTIGDIRHKGLFRPSSLIAGDTYNVVRRNDGGIGFFQVDVAGHGAPAALVSVACHHTLSQAILTRTQGTPLEAIAAQINADWPEDLPYFTMILGEIDPRLQRIAIVQAGHPSPLLIRSSGTVEAVGDGGFPIGMISTAVYERLELDFRPGDRLLVYSDGLIEAEGPEGEQFSQARLHQLVRENAEQATSVVLGFLDETLRKWRGSETLDDDLSVLMLERLAERTFSDAVH